MKALEAKKPAWMASLSGADLAVIARVVSMLRVEVGAVSADVALPSGRAVRVFPSGRVVEAGGSDAEE